MKRKNIQQCICNSSTLKKRAVFVVWCIVFALKIYSQATPKLDTLILNNGLKIYLFQHGEDPVLTTRLVINGGKKNETVCQVGNSEVILQLIKETLKEKQVAGFKKKNPVTCEIQGGQTVISGTCSTVDLNKQMELISATIARLSFRHDKIHKIIASVINNYVFENINDYRLYTLYRDLFLYGTKNSLGRNYCEYQLQKVLPGELREFYFKHYIPKGSYLLICGNFNVKEVKKMLAKQFDKWRSTHKEEKGNNDNDAKIPKIKDRTIAFINKRDLKHYLLNWVQPTPSSKSTDHAAFLLTCNLFEHYLAAKIKENINYDTLNPVTTLFKPIVYANGFMEINCVAGQNEMINTINLFDVILQTFNKLKFTETDLQAAAKNLKDKGLHNTTPESILSFYDPMAYNPDWHKNYLTYFSEVTVAELQQIVKKYFSTGSYKLIIVGKENSTSEALDLIRNVTHYQTSDFETCDESCVIKSKKKWKKRRGRCCFKCFMRGWCPCMYSPARLE